MLPREYIARSVAMTTLRRRIKNVHKVDLTLFKTEDSEEIIERIKIAYGSGASITEDDPLALENWLIYLNAPKWVGFFSIMDLLYTDFLIVESLSSVKDCLNIENLRVRQSISSTKLPPTATEVIDFSIDTAVFHLMSSVFRLRSCFDKLCILIGYALHMEKEIESTVKYDKKIAKIKSSDYTLALIQIEQSATFSWLMNLMADISDLKKLRDQEAHVRNLGVKHGFSGQNATIEIDELIKIVLINLDKFRTAFLLLLIFMHSQKEGGEFPERVKLMISKLGFFMFNDVNNKKYMSFNVEKNNAVEFEPIDFEKPPDCGIYSIPTKGDWTITIDFPSDKITKENDGLVF